MDEQLVSALSKDPFFIERYELLSALGSGGMGWVVKARDKTLANEIIALKLLYPHLVEDPQSFARFRNEVLVARRLVHPNIVRTYNFFSSGNHGGYIVMECVEGQTLAEMLETPALQLDFKEAIRILYLLSAGLSYAHAQGIIHRDLKPGNVLIREDGAVKLSDFGLAQVLRQRDEISTPGMLVGTPHYMAPEQFCNQTLDERTDIYAFGVLAYEMIAGRVPYDDASVFALAEKHLTLPLPKDQAIDASPKWFRELLQRCTEKQKADRLQSMAQVMAVLAAQVDETLESSGDENPVTQLRVYTREREILRMWKNPKLRRQIRTWVIIAFFSVSLFAIRTNPATRQRVSIPVIYLGRALGSELVWLRWFLGLPLAPSTTLNNKQMKSEQWTLLRTGADPNVPGFYPLHSGIGAISRTQVLEFLRFGADPNRKFPPWNTAPLHLLRGEFGLSLLEPLLDAGGDINIQDFVGSTPLHYAMREADLEMVKAMLKHGANPNQADSIGNTPLMYALRNGSLEQVRLLVEAGAKTDGPELDAPLATLQRELRTEIKRVLAAKRSPLPASVPAQQETK